MSWSLATVPPDRFSLCSLRMPNSVNAKNGNNRTGGGVFSSPLPVHHCVRRRHRLDHEGGREVGHEGQHDDETGAEGPTEEKTILLGDTNRRTTSKEDNSNCSKDNNSSSSIATKTSASV